MPSILTGLATVLLLLELLLRAAIAPAWSGPIAGSSSACHSERSEESRPARRPPCASTRRGGTASRDPSVAALPRNDSLGEPAPELTLQIDEATLAPELSAALAGRSLGATAFGVASVDEVVVSLTDGRLAVRGAALAGWTLLPLDLTGTAVASAGRIEVRIEDGQLGDTELPGAARREVERVIQDRIDRRLPPAGLAVRAATIGPGRLTVVGQPTGSAPPVGQSD